MEFNARFGDPETQVILPCLASDLAALLNGVATGTLGSVAPPAFHGSAVGIALASGGYPGIYPKGLPISGLPDDLVSFDDVSIVFHAGTETRAPDHLVTAGGRVMTVVGTGADLAEARSIAYDRAARITFDGMQFRTDIAARELT
ncbi:MAG: phosphoribosylglycinamide synthetase C domain-containing protein [Thermomicrobiales bacterium]